MGIKWPIWARRVPIRADCVGGQSDLKSLPTLPTLPTQHFDNMPPGRPASIRTRNFLRHLTDAEAAILAHAGDGDISAGFKNLLDWYQQMHCQSNNAKDLNGSDPN